jgi:hypothetical protein
VGGVAFLGPGQGEQDVSVFPGALAGQGPVDRGVLLGGQAPPIPAATPSDQSHHSPSVQASLSGSLGS